MIEREIASYDTHESRLDTIGKILSKKAGFDRFMKHVFKEFAHESLIFVIEITQWMEFIEIVFVSDYLLKNTCLCFFL